MGNLTADNLSDRSWTPPRWVWFALIVALFVVSSGKFVVRSFDPSWFNDDVRQHVCPYLRFHDDQLFREDPVSDYYLRCHPTGFWALYRFTAPFLDPRVTSKILPFLIFPAFAVAMWFVCRKISDSFSGWLAVLAVIAAGYPLESMGGGLQRSFSSALIAIAAAALVADRPRWLAGTAIAAAALYPVGGVLLGLTLAFYALVWPGLRNRDTGNRSWPSALILTAGTALACLAVLTPPLFGSAEYGDRIGPDLYDSYPEATQEGRSRDHLGLTDEWFLFAFFRAIEVDLWNLGARGPTRVPAAIIVTGLLLFAGYFVLKNRPRALRLLCLLAASAAAYHTAQIAYPLLYFPNRYVVQVTSILVYVIAATGVVELAALVRRSSTSNSRVRKLALAVTLPLLLILAFIPFKTQGLGISVHRARPLLDFLKTLPADSLIAGWPRGSLESVRLISERKTLVDYENHHIFHTNFTDYLRPRASLSIQATLSHSDAPLRRLYTDFGVTHFVDFPPAAEQLPWYFKPFDEDIETTLRIRGARPRALTGLADIAAVYSDAENVVLDLSLAFADRPQR